MTTNGREQTLLFQDYVKKNLTGLSCMALDEMRPPTLSAGFEWVNTYSELIEQIALTNVVDADWPILRDMLKHKLSEAIDSYLSAGPPYPLEPEGAYEARERAFDMLDSFSGPPFTIQRLCELTLTPRKHYSSLPKFLRAVNRVTAVTSTRSAFTEDDSLDPYSLPSTSAHTLDATAPPGAVTHQGALQAGGVIPTRRPAAGRSPMTSPKASPVVVPLLSPIPWLVRGEEEEEEEGEEAMSPVSTLDLAHSPGSNSSTLSPSLMPKSGLRRSSSDLNLANEPSTATPTGGVVDEVDPGSGGSDTAAPVALTHAITTSTPGAHSNEDDSLGEKRTSLAERFVRASSPKVERPLSPPTPEQSLHEKEGDDAEEATEGEKEDNGEAMEVVDETA